jgi:hypothetical protein
MKAVLLVETVSQAGNRTSMTSPTAPSLTISAASLTTSQMLKSVGMEVVEEVVFLVLNGTYFRCAIVAYFSSNRDSRETLGAVLTAMGAGERDGTVPTAVNFGAGEFVFVAAEVFTTDPDVMSVDFLGATLGVTMIFGVEFAAGGAGEAGLDVVASAMFVVGLGRSIAGVEGASSLTAFTATLFAATVRPVRLEPGDDSSSSTVSVGALFRVIFFSGGELSLMFQVQMDIRLKTCNQAGKEHFPINREIQQLFLVQNKNPCQCCTLAHSFSSLSIYHTDNVIQTYLNNLIISLSSNQTAFQHKKSCFLMNCQLISFNR